VVASAVGGILEVVKDGETGVLVPPARPDALAEALRRVLDDPALARAMGRAGRKRVEEKFSWTSVAARTQEVYAEAVDEFKRSSDD
jgi:glycosyltransferase involved in cell wall biosynthesis